MKKSIAIFFALGLLLTLPVAFAISSDATTDFYISEKIDTGQIPNLITPLEFEGHQRSFFSYAIFHVISGIILLIIFIILLIYFAKRKIHGKKSVRGRKVKKSVKVRKVRKK